MSNSVTPELEARIDQILQAASDHDLAALDRLLKDSKFSDCDAVDVQNAAGTTPLHAAIAASARKQVNGDGESLSDESAGCDTVRFLLENGAIWNQLDKNDETPGCIAWRLSLLDLYQLMVDAGVRAEILLGRLEGYEQLDDDDSQSGPEETSQELSHPPEADKEDEVPELVDASAQTDASSLLPDVNNANYLSSTLALTRDKLLDDDKNGVMMAWESDIMKQSVDHLLTRPGMKILNIGAGMMIFDTFVQNHVHKPELHHIVEAHPDVLTNMENNGWDQKAGVTIHPGKWQEILPQLVAENVTFDAIYYDTFAESYNDFKEFFSEYVLGLLEPDGKWSFFNGMGADRQISYDVYQKVAEMDLFETGFDVDWHDIEIPKLESEWEGVKQKYWNVDNYRLPVCKFMN